MNLLTAMNLREKKAKDLLGRPKTAVARKKKEIIYTPALTDNFETSSTATPRALYSFLRVLYETLFATFIIAPTLTAAINEIPNGTEEKTVRGCIKLYIRVGKRI